MNNRYAVGGAQGAFEPNSNELVLANKLGIASPDDMNEAELVLLQQLYQLVLIDEFPDRQITVADLQDWHHLWLGNVYDWAGCVRSVNMSKGDFHFAAAAQIPRLLDGFKRDCLARFTPCSGLTRSDLVEAIAVSHIELILIHPFREGNGRLSRLLADVMAVQGGTEPLDYSVWDANKPAYFAAIQAGMQCNYQPMKYWVDLALGEINAPA
ncbi:Fic/DOC family protein [Iodobacter ciconiae]|uniref:protein adenylyltransferase n=1 Tax=Iodobacter ciconiae TaxID=2496266 RepID=A0A3S8ZTJ0_9NEIS|nr:Fic family protein [Iodobacter ciconiae]AZN36741.1 cell filamentation protein Fic [Iodobacter ciconiae]